MLAILRHRICMFLVLILAVLLVHFFACSGSDPSGPDGGDEKEENTVESVTLEPGEADSLSFEGNMKITFPEDAISTETQVTIEELNITSNADVYANTGSLTPLYILKPHGQVLEKPARLEFDISEIQFPDGFSAEDLEIYSYDGETYEAQNATVEDGKLVCYISHFSMKEVRWKPGVSFWGTCDILNTPLKIYQQDSYLCFENVFGNLSQNFLKALWSLTNNPVIEEIIYTVTLYESVQFGTDNIVLAKKSCRVAWDNRGIAYEPFWGPNHLSVDGETVEESITYDDHPVNCFRWQKNTKLGAYDNYGDEYIITYDEDKNEVSDIEQTERVETNTYDFMRTVFYHDDMRKFIETTALNSDSKYYLKIEIDFNDGQFGASNSRTSQTFKLEDIPEEENQNRPPEVEISSPGENNQYLTTETITFTANVSDPEGATVSNDNVLWSSNMDGEFGRGASVQYKGFSKGKHEITCTATDDDKLSGYDQVIIFITEPVNNAPAKPSNPYPEDNSVDQPTSLTLSWECSDPENDALTFDIYFGTASNPSLVKSNRSTNSYTPGTLTEKTRYYWKIIAKDTHGNLTEGDIWQFKTAEEANTAPVAEITSPSDGSSYTEGTSITFKGTGTDAEDGSLSGRSLVWTSDKDGQIGTGTSVTISSLSINTHKITLTVTNSNGNTAKDKINIEVTESGSSNNHETGTMTDQDGNIYKTVKIGNQWWMAENLKVTHYRNGDAIPNVTDKIEWTGLSTGAYCAYDNNESNADIYGYLYNWYAVDDSRNLAPEGWHVPTDEEWKELEIFLGMSQSDAENTGYRGTNEGSKLAGSVNLWDDGRLENNAAFDESSFSALPSGYRSHFFGGSFEYLGKMAFFWLYTKNNYYAWFRGLDYTTSEVYRQDGYKQNGFSVRFVSD